MRKYRFFSVLLAALMLLCALQCVAFAADGDTLLHGEPLQVVSNPNGFGMHLQTPDGKRVAAAYPQQGLSGRKKAQSLALGFLISGRGRAPPRYSNSERSQCSAPPRTVTVQESAHKPSAVSARHT